MAHRFDVIVIGGGHNGMIAALYLAMAGKSVLVLEARETLGGASQSTRIFPQYDAHISRYAYLVSLLPDQILQELKLDFTSRPRSIASYTCYQDARGKQRGLILSNEDPALSRDSMIELTGSTGEWDRYQSFMALQHEIAALAWPSLLQPLQSRTSFESRLQSTQSRRAWEAFVQRPLGEVVEEYLKNDVVRGLVFTDAKIGVFTEPHDPSLLQNRCFLYHTIGQGTGQWRVPIGGMGALVSKLYDRCRDHHVEFQTNAPAIKILVEHPEHTVIVHQQGSETCYCAPHVLISAGPKTQARLLGRKWSHQTVDEGSVVKVNMLLKKIPRIKATQSSQRWTVEQAFTGSFHVDEGYQQMRTSYAEAAGGSIPTHPPLEIYCHTLTDSSILSPSLRDAGWHTLTLFGLDVPYRLVARDKTLEAQEKVRGELRRKYLDALNRVCDEDFESCLAEQAGGERCFEIKTGLDLENELDLDQGNIFHNAPSWFFTDDAQQVGSWGVETEYPRILLAGSSIPRGGAVSGIPGRSAAMQLLGKS